MAELKPCPFCGQEAKFIVAEKCGLCGIRARCTHCLAESDIAGLFELEPLDDAIETASEFWNKRA